VVSLHILRSTTRRGSGGRGGGKTWTALTWRRGIGRRKPRWLRCVPLSWSHGFSRAPFFFFSVCVCLFVSLSLYHLVERGGDWETRAFVCPPLLSRHRLLLQFALFFSLRVCVRVPPSVSVLLQLLLLLFSVPESVRGGLLFAV
jgi:hypothetical protein